MERWKTKTMYWGAGYSSPVILKLRCSGDMAIVSEVTSQGLLNRCSIARDSVCPLDSHQHSLSY